MADTTLAEQTRKTLDEFVSSLPNEQQQVVGKAFEQLLESDVAANAKRIGDRAPDFALPNVKGGSLRLGDALKDGPVVLSFYRGSWCPFCNLELNALQQRLGDIKKFGASLIAVSPELPDSSLDHAGNLGLQFDVLSDVGNAIAQDYGLIMTVYESLRPLYQQWGINLPTANGDTTWQLPAPATYVIDTEGLIRACYVEKDYSQRMEPVAIIEALAELQG